jgi:hypothetical protein
MSEANGRFGSSVPGAACRLGSSPVLGSVRVSLHVIPLQEVPVDFFADPDLFPDDPFLSEQGSVGRLESALSLENALSVARAGSAPVPELAFDELCRLAGFEPDQGVAVGALTRPFAGHPEGSAVVTLNSSARPYVAIVEVRSSGSILSESSGFSTLRRSA